MSYCTNYFWGSPWFQTKRTSKLDRTKDIMSSMIFLGKTSPYPFSPLCIHNAKKLKSSFYNSKFFGEIGKHQYWPVSSPQANQLNATKIALIKWKLDLNAIFKAKSLLGSKSLYEYDKHRTCFQISVILRHIFWEQN